MGEQLCSPHRIPQTPKNYFIEKLEAPPLPHYAEKNKPLRRQMDKFPVRGDCWKKFGLENITSAVREAHATHGIMWGPMEGRPFKPLDALE